MRRKIPDIIERLRGGDLRSIGKANEIVQEVKNNPVLFDTVFNGLSNDEPVVRMRAADVIEKVTRDKPELLTDYTSKVISILKVADQQEVCWHMAQIAPRLNYTSLEENRIIEILKAYLMHKSKIVRVSAMESLAVIAENNNDIMSEVIDIIKVQIQDGGPAVQSRGRKLLERLKR